MIKDSYYLLQNQYAKGIYSHETALYLLGYLDNPPAAYTMTFPKGYNSPSLKKENVIIKRVVPENYSFGITEAKSPEGKIIRVYDIERTLCDILRGQGSDVRTVSTAMKKYVQWEEKDIDKLFRFAEQLRVKPKVQRYIEILL